MNATCLAPSITDFVTDPGLLGLSISAAQRTLLKSIYGEELDSEELATWQLCTGRETYPAKPFQEVTVLAGARSGKDSRIAAPIILFEALFGGHRAAKGERLVFPLVAQDHRATKIAFAYIKDYLTRSPVLAGEVEEVRASDIELANGAQIVCFPCTQSSLRGWSIPSGVMDELAHWRLEGAVDSDSEVQTSIRRGGLSFAQTRLVKISTPYMKSGVLYEDFSRHFGKDSQDCLVWKASSSLMNPTISQARLDRERRLDPTRFAREYEAEFALDLSAAFDHENLAACTVSGRRELPPQKDFSYVAFCDPAAGGADAFTLAISHRDGNRAVLDAVRSWRSRNPSGTVSECADILRSYRIGTVVGDRYSGQWVREAFRTHGVSYEVSQLDRSALYLEMVATVNSRAVELLENPIMLKEFQNLERKVGSAGRDRIDHPGGQHDDIANAVAGSTYLVSSRRSEVLVW